VPAVALSLESQKDAFADVEPRGSIDYMLRTMQQQLVDLSGQADLKASIVMTTSAILTSIAAGRLGHESVRWSLVTFIVGLVAAMLCAVFSLVPTFSTRLPKGQSPNPLFFGHFGSMRRVDYLDAMAELMQSDSAVYRTIVADVYEAGRYLLQHKYRFLRLSYLLFMAAFVVAGAQQLVTIVVR
jgi:Pycsar effector protein